MSAQTLGELAQIIRSKNAKPFRVTFDIVFSDAATYERVKGAQVLTRASIANLYGIDPDEIISVPRVRSRPGHQVHVEAANPPGQRRGHRHLRLSATRAAA